MTQDIAPIGRARSDAPGGRKIQSWERSSWNLVVFEGISSLFHSRFQVQSWLKRTQRRLEEEQMSYAERHVRWMIENNCEDHGNPWPE